MKGRLEDLDPDHLAASTDDRWTLHKLMQAGYQLEWERDCRTCGDEIECYRNDRTQRLLILNAVVLTPHHCDGT